MNYFFKCFKNYADFSGRATRKEYWSFTLVNSLIIGILSGLSTYAESNMYDYLSLNLLILLIVWSVVIFIPSLSVTVRRLHDVGKSGWYILLSLVPYANIVVFVYTLKDSDSYENEYGPNPKDERGIVSEPLYTPQNNNTKQPQYQQSQQESKEETPSKPRFTPIPFTDKTKCPVCNRRNYRENNYCKWCGAIFDADNNVIQGQKTRPANYFRNIWDMSNVIKYETLDDALNMKFMNYIFNNFKDCQMETRVEVKTLIPSAPDYAMPFNFLLTKEGTKLGIVLVSQSKYKRYSVLETRELCKENNIKMLSFCIERENNEEYVVNRIRQTLEA